MLTVISNEGQNQKFQNTAICLESINHLIWNRNQVIIYICNMMMYRETVCLGQLHGITPAAVKKKIWWMISWKQLTLQSNRNWQQTWFNLISWNTCNIVMLQNCPCPQQENKSIYYVQECLMHMLANRANHSQTACQELFDFHLHCSGMSVHRGRINVVLLRLYDWNCSEWLLFKLERTTADLVPEVACYGLVLLNLPRNIAMTTGRKEK